MNHKHGARAPVSRVHDRVSAVLLCLFLLIPSRAPAVEPDWPQLEKHALEFLQQYLRIRSINPPADTTNTAALIKAELERHGLTPKLYESGPAGQVNVIPSTSEASLDCRVLPGVKTDQFISELKARINDPRVTVEIISVSPDPGVSSTKTPLYAAMRQAILKHHPDAIVTPMIVPHGTDSSKLHMRGVIKYGFTPMILDTDTAATMHSDQERIPVAEFLKGIHIFYDLLASQF